MKWGKMEGDAWRLSGYFFLQAGRMGIYYRSIRYNKKGNNIDVVQQDKNQRCCHPDRA